MTYTMKARGPKREGCHDLKEIRPAKWHRLGGIDIVTWPGANAGSYTVEASTLAALAYAEERLGLEVEEIEVMQ